MHNKSQDLADYAKACLQIKTVYVWGGLGELLTPDVLLRKAAQYPDRIEKEKLIEMLKLSDGSRHIFDCSGLIKRFLMGGLSGFRYDEELDTNAQGLLQKAVYFGPVETMPECEGICLYMKDHVGIYIGKDEVVEATSNSEFGNGVVKTRLCDRAWEKWFCCREIDYPENVQMCCAQQMKEP